MKKQPALKMIGIIDIAAINEDYRQLNSNFSAKDINKKETKKPFGSWHWLKKFHGGPNEWVKPEYWADLWDCIPPRFEQELLDFIVCHPGSIESIDNLPFVRDVFEANVPHLSVVRLFFILCHTVCLSVCVLCMCMCICVGRDVNTN